MCVRLRGGGGGGGEGGRGGEEMQESAVEYVGLKRVDELLLAACNFLKVTCVCVCVCVCVFV